MEQKFIKLETDQKDFSNEIEKQTEELKDLSKKLTRIDNEIIKRESNLREQRVFCDKL